MSLNVSFYHLTLSPVEKILPRLLEKVYAAKMRVHIIVENDEKLAALNTSLWTYSTLAFLPHGCVLDHADAQLDQPLWLSTALENVNQATVCAVTNGQIISDPVAYGFSRILDVFDATTADATYAKERALQYQNMGATIAHWEQTKEGWKKL